MVKTTQLKIINKNRKKCSERKGKSKRKLLDEKQVGSWKIQGKISYRRENEKRKTYGSRGQKEYYRIK